MYGYETADLFSANKRKIVEELVEECRAGLIAETPERNKASRPATKRTAPANKPAPVKKPAPAKKPAPTFRSKTAEELRNTVNDTVRKSNEDITALKSRMNQITQDIANLAKVPGNSAAVLELKKERDAISEKISKLEGIKRKNLSLLHPGKK